MNIRHLVVKIIADRQHACGFALELHRTWTKKVDYYNLSSPMTDVLCRFLPMYDLSDKTFAKIFNEACLLLKCENIKFHT